MSVLPTISESAFAVKIAQRQLLLALGHIAAMFAFSPVFLGFGKRYGRRRHRIGTCRKMRRNVGIAGVRHWVSYSRHDSCFNFFYTERKERNMADVLQASYKMNKNLQRYGHTPPTYTQIVQPNQNALFQKYRNQTKKNVTRSTSSGLVRRMIRTVTPISGGTRSGKRSESRSRREGRRNDVRQQKMITRKRSRNE